MTYGHAERTLATIRLLESETAGLLRGLPWLDAEQSAWLCEFNSIVELPQTAGSRSPVAAYPARRIVA
jgi:hypothetical protein